MSFLIRIIIFCLFTFYSLLSLASQSNENQKMIDYFINKSRKVELYKKNEWQKMLFYQKKYFSAPKGIVDSKNFYISSEGKINLEKEMDETIRAFFSNSEENSIQCRFPRRLKWLKHELDDKNYQFPVKKCEKLENWLQLVDPKGVVLVFSSSYINNPASMFGHTFLQIKNSNNPLTDFGVNFAANPDTENFLLYSLKGLSGFFEGRFNLLPYSIKVQEYNNSESRDIYEYELNLSPDEINNMILSLWEVGDHEIDYYYMDENCSFIMLALLDTANPNYNFTDQFLLWVNPADTIRAVLSHSGILKKLTFRPSAEKRFLFRYQLLNSYEKNKFENILNFKLSPSLLVTNETKQTSAKVLDAVAEYIDYKEKLAGTSESKKYPLFRKEILTQRARLAVASAEMKSLQVEAERPERGLPGGRVGVLSSYSSSMSWVLDADFVPVLHSIDSPSLGYSRDAQIDLMRTVFRYQLNKNDVFLNSLTLVDIISSPSFEAPLYPVSWNLKLGVEQDLDCNAEEFDSSCRRYFLQGGGGLSYATSFIKFYSFPEIDFAYQNRNAFEVSLGSFSGFSFNHFDTLVISFALEWLRRYSFLQDAWRTHFNIDSSLSFIAFSDLEMRIFYKKNLQSLNWETGLGVYLHFF